MPMLALAAPMFAQAPTAQADSAWLFTYATQKNANHNGLHYAWSTDQVQWNEIGPEWAAVKSDYGEWGSQKRMLDPRVQYNPETRLWEATWMVNEQESVLAYANSADLILWKPQDYFCSEASKEQAKGTGRLLRPFSQSRYAKARDYMPDTTSLYLPNAGMVCGQKHRVAWSLIHNLITAHQLQLQKNAQNGERAVSDKNGQFRRLQPQQISVSVLTEGQKEISDKLIGIFFEDINYAADGGLYAELLQNRDFEYNGNDGRDWNPLSWWEVEGMKVSVETADPIHVNNQHYLSLVSQPSPLSPKLTNLGWEGIPVKAGAKYDFSLFGRVPEGSNGKVKVQLVGNDGNVLA